jgi:hypothetical protein
LCYRDDVPCGERLLSVETKDTGPEEASVQTRVLDEDHRLLATRTVPYADYVDMSDYDPDDFPAVIQLIMEEQHQAMVTATGEGLFADELQEATSATPLNEKATAPEAVRMGPEAVETEPEADDGADNAVDEAGDDGLGTPLLVRDLEGKPASQVNLFGMMTLDEVILNSLVSRRR